MSTTIFTWDDEYSRIARAASQLRTTTNTFYTSHQNNYKNNTSNYSSNTNNSNHSQNHTERQDQIRSIQIGLSRLKVSLDNMHSSGMMNSTEYNRRMGLVDNLDQQFGNHNGNANGNGSRHDGDLLGMGNNGGGGGGGGGRMSMATQALRHQDHMIDELASGVARLKDQTLMINDEANMQNRMLDDVSDSK